jgi:predicted DNA-binding transcriptional regulator AlpA
MSLLVIERSATDRYRNGAVITMEYEFLFVVAGVPVDDSGAVTAITENLGGLLSRHHAPHRLAVSGEGTGASDALQKLLNRVVVAAPGLRLVRLDADLVGVSDIAERTGHTRQNVQQWVNGERNGDRPFPPPEGSAGRSLIWRWAEVNAWLKPLGLDDRAVRPTREESAFLDVALIEWHHAHAADLTADGQQEPARRAAAPAAPRRESHGTAPGLRHSPEMRRKLISRVQSVTGRGISQWFAELDSGPAFLRTEERAQWLADEHGLSYGYASAIAQEYALRREGLPASSEADQPERP